MWKKIANWLASIRQSIQFVAFFANFGVAALVVENFNFGYRWIAAGIVIILGAIKEFVFDSLYEKNPPQTFLDNLEDWSGWVVGAVTGVILSTFC